MDNKKNENYDHSLTLTSRDNENIVSDRCYQCIICGPMFFQSKKNNLRKRLWRSRVSSTTSTSRHSHQEPPPSYPQLDQYSQLTSETSAESYYYPQQQENLNHHRHHCGLVRDEGSSLLSTTTAVLKNCCTNSNSSSSSDLTDQPTYQLFRALVSQLKKESQLETLCQAIECVGSSTDASNKMLPYQYQPTDCVLVPRGLICGEEPQVIACRLWRWSDLYDARKIKRVPSCPNEKDPVYICCNPAHWSRLCPTGKSL